MCESEDISDFLGKFLGKSFFRFNWEDMNVFWVNFFDFNTTIFGAYNSWSLWGSVKNKGQVKFLNDVNSFMDQDSIDSESLFGSLMCNQIISDHLFSEFSDLFCWFTYFDSPFETAGEMTFSSSSCMYLGFKY